MERATYAYWYIYAYIALLMTLPFLRMIVKSMSENYYKYLILLYLLFISVIPCLEYLLFQGDLVMYKKLRPEWILADTVFWPLLGYYLENVYDWKKCTVRTIWRWILLGVTGILLTCGMIYYMHGVTGVCTKEKVSGLSFCFHPAAVYSDLYGDEILLVRQSRTVCPGAGSKRSLYRWEAVLLVFIYSICSSKNISQDYGMCSA